MFTNTTPVGAYRGAGRPEGNYYMERLIDTAAREMGIDSVELRRRNHIRPEQMPYKAPSGTNYDSAASSPTLLDKALQAADWQGFDARKAESQARGKLRGRGIGYYLEVTGAADARRWRHPLRGRRHRHHASPARSTTARATATPFAQVLTDKLGIPFERIRLLQGDSDQLIAGGGTGGSKSAHGARRGDRRGRRQGDRARASRSPAHVLEASAADIEFARGRFTIAGTDRGIGIMELAEQAARRA